MEKVIPIKVIPKKKNRENLKKTKNSTSHSLGFRIVALILKNKQGNVTKKLDKI